MAQDPWEQEAAKMKSVGPSSDAQVYAGISAEPPAQKVSDKQYQGVSTPPQEGSVTGTASDFGPQDPAYKMWTQPDQDKFSTRLIKDIPHAFGEMVKGGLREIPENIRSIGGMEYGAMPKFLKDTGYGRSFAEGLSTLGDLATPQNELQGFGKGTVGAAEFLIPGGAEEAGAAKLAELVPKITENAPTALRVLRGMVPAAAKTLTSGLGAGAVNVAQGGGFVPGFEMGAGGAALGGAAQSLAPAIAESALKIRGTQRLFGRTPGRAILEDTTGIRPETIAKSAQEKIGQLEPIIKAADTASAARGEMGSLTPAREAVEDTMATHRANRAMGTVADIQPVADFLKNDQLTGQPLSEAQTALGLRAMKRGLNTDYIGKWSLDQPIAQKGAARKAYGELNQELHGLVPETKDLDQRVSSLIPVVQQGQRVASGAPTVQRALGRFAVPTGALTLGGIGGFQGYRRGGVPGAIAGGLTGLLLPELVSSPEGQMAVARTFHRAGSLRPLVGVGAQVSRPQQGDNQ